ncbi:MAG: hypothetical protein K1X79_13475 [Oligoflexia bacterium]|nr:hypothetical protein [Oligoflexia bacterium]
MRKPKNKKITKTRSKRAVSSKRSSISPDKMAETLLQVRSLARYDLLSGMPIEFFSPELGQALRAWDTSSLKDLCELSLDDLARMGREAPYLLPAIMKLAQQLLLDVEEESTSASLNPVCAPAVEPQVGMSWGVFPARKPIASQREQTFSVNSIEAEQRLTLAIDRLRATRDFARISERTIGEFWEKQYGSAPFEQSITFRQLREMHPRALLEKRSFGSAKILGMVRAVDLALSEQVATQQPASQLMEPNAAVALRIDGISDVAPIWSVPLSCLPSSMTLVLRYYEQQINRLSNEQRPFARFVLALPKSLTSEEFCCLWIRQDFGEEVAAQALKLDAVEFARQSAAADRKIEALFAAESGELKGYWEIALRSPGIQLARLVEVAGLPNIDKDFVTGLVRLTARALGARQPIAFGMDLSGYWTKNPQALQLNMGSLVASLPKPDQAVQEDFGAMFPFIDAMVLREILSKLAVFDDATGVWKRRDGAI